MKKRIVIVLACGATLAMAGLHAKFFRPEVSVHSPLSGTGGLVSNTWQEQSSQGRQYGARVIASCGVAGGADGAAAIHYGGKTRQQYH
jgi:hypothetical protein